MTDTLKLGLVVGLAAILTAIVCLGFVAWENAGSRNLALATGTLAAAALLFVIQLPFELRSSASTEFISAEYTIDRATPQIRQWSYTVQQGQRLNKEVAASDLLATTNPASFTADTGKLTHDMVLFSLLAYFGTEQFDWQINRTRFSGQSMGTLILTMPQSIPAECTVITRDQIHHAFLNAGNLFAAGNIFFASDRLCLPPQSSITLTTGSLVIENPFCTISFVLEPSNAVQYTKPGTGGSVPPLPSGEPQFETRLTGVRITTVFVAIRAQHREMKKYQEWAKRIVDGAQIWFEGQ